ncbi:hypothetical protein GCM10027517_30810 [Phycicoccus ginsengisoli]
MDGTRHPGVDAYLDGLPAWQRDLCQRLREVVHAADPEIEETVKRRVRPYFVLEGNVCALLAARDHVNLFVYDPIAPDPHGLVNQGHGNATARAIQYHEGDPVREEELTEFLRSVVADNRAGGWRRIQQRGS